MNFTLIIPTHNRHEYLKRSFEFFKDLKAAAICCDSSSTPYCGEIGENITYLHVPGEGFAQKMIHAINVAETDYIACCADDDFILHQSLYESVVFLESHREFKTSIGGYLAFYDNYDGKFYSSRSTFPRDINYDISKNADVFFSNYYILLWAMHAKENLLSSYKICAQAAFENNNFLEMVIGAVSAATGGIKFMDNLWGVRELSGQMHWGDLHKPIYDFYRDKNIRRDFIKMKELLDPITYGGYSDLVLKSYISGYGIRNDFDKLREVIKGLTKTALCDMLKICGIVQRQKPTGKKNNSFEKYPNLIPFDKNSDYPELCGIDKILSKP